MCLLKTTSYELLPFYTDEMERALIEGDDCISRISTRPHSNPHYSLYKGARIHAPTSM